MPTKKTNIKDPKIKDPKMKQKKAKTAKVKKTKPPKSGKKGLLPKNKRVLVLVAAGLMLVIVGSAQAVILLTMRNKNTEKEAVPKAPEYYFSKDEDVSSFTAIVGNRSYEIPASEPESQEETTADQSIPAGKVYRYVHLDDSTADLNSYLEYLENQKNFIDITQNNTSTADNAEKEAENGDFLSYQLSGPSSDPKSYLSITLESTGDSLVVTSKKGDEPWNNYFKDQWDQQKKVIEDIQKQPKSETSIEQAENTVRDQGQSKLKLSESADSYEYIASPGISKIDGKDYYTVRTYKRQPDDTLIYVATYLCDYSNNSVGFQYDEVTGQTTPLG